MTTDRSIDLHGCTVREAISLFTDFYNDCVRSGYRGRIKVIHGYGSSGHGGAIQTALRQYLASHAARLETWTLGDSIGNPGITSIYPKELIPAPSGSSESNAARDAILRFCDKPKAKAKVIAKLTGRFGDRALQEEIARMTRDGLLREVDGKLQR